MSKWKLMVLMFGLVLLGIGIAACSASRLRTEQSSAAKSASAGSNSIGTVVGDTAPDFLLTGLGILSQKTMSA